MKRIHILKTGTFEGADGTPFTFAASDLAAIATNYDPTLGEAPLTCGHPKTDHPAFGWVERLEFDAGSGNLYAVPKQVPAEFSAAVARGAFKKISVALFGPKQSANPKPGNYYVRHVGFLGAHVPAIPGLSPIEFAAPDDADVSVEFSAPGAYTVARLFRRMREWLIADRGLEAADQVIPDYDVADLEAVSRAADADDSAPAFPPFSFSAPSTEPDMTAATQAALDARKNELDERQRALDARDATFAAQAQQTRRASIAADVDTAVQAGRVLPAERGLLVEFAARIQDGETIEFAAADGSIETVQLFDRWKQFLAALPVRVDTGERAAPAAEAGTTSATFSAPEGYAVNPAQLEIHNKALAYITAHPGTSYDQAALIAEQS